jgi:hypothetical protein
MRGVGRRGGIVLVWDWGRPVAGGLFPWRRDRFRGTDGWRRGWNARATWAGYRWVGWSGPSGEFSKSGEDLGEQVAAEWSRRIACPARRISRAGMLMRRWRGVAIIALLSRAPQPENWSRPDLRARPSELMSLQFRNTSVASEKPLLGWLRTSHPKGAPRGFRRVARILNRKVQMRPMSASRHSGRKTL